MQSGVLIFMSILIRQSMPESVRQIPRQATNMNYMDPYVSTEPYISAEPYPSQTNWYKQQSYSQPPPTSSYTREPYQSHDYNQPRPSYYHHSPSVPAAHNPNYMQLVCYYVVPTYLVI